MNIERLDDFITQMPKTLDSVLKKARYMYLELGKRSFYDRKIEHMMFGEEEQFLIYSHKNYETPNIIICTTLIQQYQELLNKLGIVTRIIIDSSGHSYLEFEDEQGVSYKTDLTRDLKNIQFNCSTSYFARENIDSSILRKIDLELNYITEHKGYSNEYWHILKDRLNSRDLSDRQRLEIVLNSMQEFGDLTKLGQSELFSMYEKFVKYCNDGKRNTIFYTSKISNRPDEFYVKLNSDGQQITYKLNKNTLMFNLDNVKEIENLQH